MLRQAEPQWNSTACRHGGGGYVEKREGGYGVVVVRQYIKSGLTINRSTNVSYKLFSDVFCFQFMTTVFD